MAKPLLSCQVTAHQPSAQSVASIKAPPGILPTISLVVPGEARRLTVVIT